MQLLERDRIQAMIDEIALSQSGRTDAGTALRAGKLIRAGRVVQGAITQTGAQNLTVNAAVMNVATSQQQGRDVQSSDVLDQIFTIEKNLALGIFDQLGVRLSAAERAAIEQRPTRSLQAFLAYSNGLLASDEGRYDDAARFFDQGAQHRPRLRPGAAEGAERARRAAGLAGDGGEGRVGACELQRRRDGQRRRTRRGVHQHGHGIDARQRRG